MKLEVCSDTIDVAIAASQHANRIEWCSALDLGGLTPHPGLTQELLREMHPDCEVHAMIRPRTGNFNYSELEFEAMKHDIVLFAKLGVHGVVYGCLNERDELDLERTKVLTIMAKSLRMHTTFHRAIDVCTNPHEAIQSLIKIGVDRVLTSGGQPTAFEGLEQIKSLNELSKNKIEIMPGSGINPSNAHLFLLGGCTSIHFSCHKKVNDAQLGFGNQYVFDQVKFDAIQSKIR